MADKNLHVTQSVHGEAAVDEEPFRRNGKEIESGPVTLEPVVSAPLDYQNHSVSLSTPPPFPSPQPCPPSPKTSALTPSSISTALITSLMLSDDPVSLRSPSPIAAKLEA